MITGNEPISPIPYTDGYGSIFQGVNANGQDMWSTETTGLTIREYMVTHSPVTWHDAQCKFNDCYKKNGSIEEIANFLAEMQIAAANALIQALNQPTNTTAP